jgi:hypothetical protein
MQRIKPHFCWVKAVAEDAADADKGGSRRATAIKAEPLTSTSVFRVLPTDELPALQANDLGVGMRTATGVFRTMVGKSLGQISAQDLLPRTATAKFRALTDASLPPLEAFDLHLSIDAEPDTDTTPIRLMLGDSLPPLTFAGATFMGGWQAEPDPFGAPGGRVALYFMPIVGTRGDALDWRTTEAGRSWADGALAISLLSFTAIGDF